MAASDQNISATLPQSIFSFLEQASSNDHPSELHSNMQSVWRAAETNNQAFSSPTPLHNVFGLASLDTGLTPTPTNENLGNIKKSPDSDILAPKAKLDATLLRGMSGQSNSKGDHDSSGISSVNTGDLSDTSMDQSNASDVNKEIVGQAISTVHSGNQQPLSQQAQAQFQKEQELLAAAQLLNVNPLLSPLYYQTMIPNLVASQQGNQELVRLWLEELYGRNNPAANEILLRTLLASQSTPTYPYAAAAATVPTLAYPLAAAGLYNNSLPQTVNASNSVLSSTVSEPPAASSAAASQASSNAASSQSSSVNAILSYQQEVSSIANYYRGVMHHIEDDIEKAANVYRNAASTERDPSYHWHGKLPVRLYKTASFSRKVFLGGVPWDITDMELQQAFMMYGSLFVLWPAKDNQMASSSRTPPKGYCYLIFDNENSVKSLVKNCSRDVNANSGELYYKISSTKMKAKEVQVIPWCISDSQFTKQGSHRLDAKRTVFIGALHGMITAEALANIMNDLFGNVAFTALDTDKYKYPIGSGRVAFTSQKSYQKAVEANFVDVQTPKFNKTIQIDPYLEDSMCNYCFFSAGIYFCRAFDCFRYFCPACWQFWHNSVEAYCNHKPLRRTFKKSG